MIKVMMLLKKHKIRGIVKMGAKAGGKFDVHLNNLESVDKCV